MRGPFGGITRTFLTGHTYTTYRPACIRSRHCVKPTATLWPGEPPVVEPTANRAAMMPKRRHTRAHHTAKAIAAERKLNDAHVAERNNPPPF